MRYGAVFKGANSKNANKFNKYASIEDIFDESMRSIHHRAMTFRDKAAAHIQNFSELAEVYAKIRPDGYIFDIGTTLVHCSPVYLFPDVVPHLGALIDRALEWFRLEQIKAGRTLSQLAQGTIVGNNPLEEPRQDIITLAKELLNDGDNLLTLEYKKRGLIR